jgi:hypothetical protein
MPVYAPALPSSAAATRAALSTPITKLAIHETISTEAARRRTAETGEAVCWNQTKISPIGSDSQRMAMLNEKTRWIRLSSTARNEGMTPWSSRLMPRCMPSTQPRRSTEPSRSPT